MTGILVIISMFFGVAGYAYGKGAGTITGSVQAINARGEDLLRARPG